MSRLASVTVALLSWNGRRHLESCLDALDRQLDPGISWEIAILDNGSTDGTWEWLEREWPRDRRLGATGSGRIRMLRSETNLGFCAGNNLLVEATEADAVVFLNNDTRPEPDWLGSITAALAGAAPDVAAVSGLIVDWEGERLDFAEGVMTFDGHAFQRHYHRALREVELPAEGSELLFACGGNMAVRRSSFLEAGRFDDRYFAYLEDVDLGWRLGSGGERVVLARHARVHHRSLATSEMLGTWNRGYLFERNAFLTAYKNYDSRLWPHLMPAVILTLLARTQALLVQNNAGGEELATDPYAPPAIAKPAEHSSSLLDRIRRRGLTASLKGAARRARRSAAEWLEPGPRPRKVRLDDPRSLAQLQAVSNLLGGLGPSAAARERVQARRRRADGEIFARFPLLLVPTYPGDEALFADPGFRAWLPREVALEERTLGELMSLEPNPSPDKPA
jgi:GT2 family glycosyltransferase